MRLLVCGGRDYKNAQKVFDTLTAIANKKGIELIIHGAAKGADTWADIWAVYCGIERMPFPVSGAEWDRHGKRAGHLRNAKMIEFGKPDGVVAFPGGKGTANMVDQATKAGITVMRVRD